jgi:hypothetical protein
MSLEMAQKVIVPQKKNYVPQFLKQRDINSYCASPASLRIFKTIAVIQKPRIINIIKMNHLTPQLSITIDGCFQH